MFAGAWLRGWPKDEPPPIQAIGVKHVPEGVMCYLLHVQPNRSRAKTVRLNLYGDTGEVVDSLRVEWPGWSDCEMAGVILNAV